MHRPQAEQGRRSLRSIELAAVARISARFHVCHLRRITVRGSGDVAYLSRRYQDAIARVREEENANQTESE